MCLHKSMVGCLRGRTWGKLQDYAEHQGLIIVFLASRCISLPWPQFFNSFNSHLLSLGSDFSLTNHSQVTVK